MFSKRPKGATIQDDKKSGISGLLWMLFGAIVTLAVGVVAYKSPMFGFDDKPNNTQTIENNDEPRVKPKIETDKDNDYQFYDILPEQKMKSIPEDAMTPQKIEEDIENRTKQFKPDAVITEDIENKKTELYSSDKSRQKNNIDTQDESEDSNSLVDGNESKPKKVTGDNEMVIVYENSTYDGTPVKKTTIQPKQEVAESLNNQTTGNNLPAKNSKKDSTEADNSTEEASANIKPAQNNISHSETKSTKPNKSYVLQINSYDTADEADKRRAQVLMSGVDAHVIRRTNGGQTVYQVVSNPMTNTKAVIRAQQSLQKNGIDSLIIEQQRK